MKRYFITGTDTASGKTYATCQLVDYFKSSHKRVRAIKPIASGCMEQDGQLISEDVLRLSSAFNDPKLDICPWRFKLPIAPHLAAEDEGQRLTANAVLEFCHHDAFADLDYLLIEGAGGLMVPLNSNETWIDFLISGQIPVILVVGMRLGCLNHALLTDLVLTLNNILCVGWIANCVEKEMLKLEANIKTLEERINSPLLGTIGYKASMVSSRALNRI